MMMIAKIPHVVPSIRIPHFSLILLSFRQASANDVPLQVPAIQTGSDRAENTLSEPVLFPYGDEN